MKKWEIIFVSILIIFLFFGSILIFNKGNNIINYYICDNCGLYSKASQINTSFKLFRPQKIKNSFLVLNSKSALAACLNLENKNLEPKILYQKNIEKVLPIASLTKLMTAVIVLENYSLNEKIKIPKEAVSTYGEAGELKEGEVLSVENLLYIMLMESSNDAAEALAMAENRDIFIEKMNQKAKELFMNSTYFSNPTGLDFEETDTNFSSADDLLKLVIYILKKYPEIGKILENKEYDLFSFNGSFHHKLLNTNQMLEDNNAFWGKTGFTLKAKDCLVNLTKKDNHFIIITIILGADNKFEETKKLLNWLDNTYLW